MSKQFRLMVFLNISILKACLPFNRSFFIYNIVISCLLSIFNIPIKLLGECHKLNWDLAGSREQNVREMDFET